MEYAILIFILISTLIIIKIGLNIKIKDLQKIKQIAYSDENNNLIKDFPNNKQICKEMLKMLNNSTVAVEDAKDEKSKTSVYLVMQNKIIIANIDKTFTRIQTIAHECVHSVQNKVMLKFNFIISNVNTIYFLAISILTISGKINNLAQNILLAILIALQFAFFTVRNLLETDAMIRAEALSKEYIEKTVSKEKTNKIISKYKELNKVGIKAYTFMLIIKMIIKPVLYSAIAWLK